MRRHATISNAGIPGVRKGQRPCQNQNDHETTIPTTMSNAGMAGVYRCQRPCQRPHGDHIY
jgi:hypothetical protein